MQQGIRRLVALAAVFAVAFAAVYFIRNGPAGFTRLWTGGASSTGPDFRPERFTMPDQPPLDLGDVELLSRLNNEYASSPGGGAVGGEHRHRRRPQRACSTLWGRTRAAELSRPKARAPA